MSKINLAYPFSLYLEISMENLASLINQHIDKSFCLTSRTHKLNQQPFENSTLFVKRDDELSFGISGSKLRKYSSLIPFLKLNEIQTVYLAGSPYSNHLVGILQLLNEHQIKAVLFTKKSFLKEKKGNHLLLEMLFNGSHWVELDAEDWQKRDAIIIKEVQKCPKSFYVKEGCENVESLFGMMTLGLDIQSGEYNHIFIDSGTGFAAASLILSLKELGNSATVHVIQMAELQAPFEDLLKKLRKWLEPKLGKVIEPQKYHLHSPSFCKAFGSTNASTFSFIRQFAKDEGILLDPIYSSKLFISAPDIIKKENLTGNILLIHSGGALSLTGFMDQLSSSGSERFFQKFGP